MAQWATTSYKATEPYDGTDIKFGHKRVTGTVYGGQIWSYTGEDDRKEHSYIF